MKNSRKRAALAILASALALNAGTLSAADTSSALSMRPLHGISFDVGGQRAVAYFTGGGGSCKLVLTIAEASNSYESFTSTRIETAVSAGKSTHYDSTEFACAADAQSMTASTARQVAAAQSE